MTWFCGDVCERLVNLRTPRRQRRSVEGLHNCNILFINEQCPCERSRGFRQPQERSQRRGEGRLHDYRLPRDRREGLAEADDSRRDLVRQADVHDEDMIVIVVD